MLYNDGDEQRWEKTFKEKLKSFLQKCPAIFKMRPIDNGYKRGILITHPKSKKEYFYEYDYSRDIKDVIHDIKLDLMKLHYPRICETIYTERQKTALEIAEELEKVDDISKISKDTKDFTKKIIWRIDRVMLWNNSVLMVKEYESDGKNTVPIESKSASIYSYSSSIVMFLSNLRRGKWQSIEEAGEDFFENAIYIKEVPYIL